MTEEAKTIMCRGCCGQRPAAYQLEIDRVIDDDYSENCAVFFCEECTVRARGIIESCETALYFAPPAEPGEAEIVIYRLSEKDLPLATRADVELGLLAGKSRPEKWRLCAVHCAEVEGIELGELQEETEARDSFAQAIDSARMLVTEVEAWPLAERGQRALDRMRRSVVLADCAFLHMTGNTHAIRMVGLDLAITAMRELDAARTHFVKTVAAEGRA